MTNEQIKALVTDEMVEVDWHEYERARIHGANPQGLTHIHFRYGFEAGYAAALRPVPSAPVATPPAPASVPMVRAGDTFVQWARGHGNFDLGIMRKNGRFSRFMDPDTDTAWLGFKAAWDRLAALSDAPGEGWRSMDSAPKDGTRILLAWKPVGGLSEHVELGKWKSRQGWSNTYGHAFSGEPDAWAPLAPFALPAASPTGEDA